MKALEITTYPLRGQGECHVLYSCANASSTSSVYWHDIDIGTDDGSNNYNNINLSTEGCFLLHYESPRTESLSHKCTVCFNDADFHCYPYIIGLLVRFFDRLSVYGKASDGAYSNMVDAEVRNTMTGFGFQRFGFSNFFETGSSEYASIPLDHFPFVTISNSDPIASLESSLLYPNSEWRKHLNLRNGKFKSSKFSKEVGSKFFHAPPSISTPGIQAFHVCRTSAIADPFVVDLHFCRIRVHFHDSSCIIGTVSLPISQSSLFINENSMDILCSTEGLTLSSSWCTQNFHEFLWGPSLPNLSPILNMRVRKEKSTSLSSSFEVSISIQHVHCVLPAEYLAIIIGYFSLPDWSSNVNNQPVTEGHEYIATGIESSVVYKFEILESSLILPVESNERQFLQVDIRQLLCSLINDSIPDNVLEEMPLEYVVPAYILARSNLCLNVFGRDILLSFLLFKDDGYGCSTLAQNTDCVRITLVSSLSADVWVTIPCISESLYRSSPSTTCVMTRIINCQVMADGRSFTFYRSLI